MDGVVLLGNVRGRNLFCPIFSHADFIKTTKQLTNIRSNDRSVSNQGCMSRLVQNIK